MPKRVTKRARTCKAQNKDQKNQGIPKGSSSSPKETKKHAKNHDPTPSLNPFPKGWKAAGVELSLSNSHPENVPQEDQKEPIVPTFQFLAPSPSADQKSNANHQRFGSNANQVSRPFQNQVKPNEISGLQWSPGVQTFSDLLRGSHSSHERSIYPSLLQDEHTESSENRPRSGFFQAQATQDPIAAGTFPNKRYRISSLYDPIYEAMGLPVDPILRCFVLIQQAENKGKSFPNL
ncbi:uncharacterized protein [Coffea arabica]|uniref:Uncharacterized protein n=1 Tax=Coffea arabica TaxID=13443 RepID=A0ABM4VQ57_COFAR